MNEEEILETFNRVFQHINNQINDARLAQSACQAAADLTIFICQNKMKEIK